MVSLALAGKGALISLVATRVVLGSGALYDGAGCIDAIAITKRTFYVPCSISLIVADGWSI